MECNGEQMIVLIHLTFFIIYIHIHMFIYSVLGQNCLPYILLALFVSVSFVL